MNDVAYETESSYRIILREPLPPIPESRIVDVWLRLLKTSDSFRSLCGRSIQVVRPGVENEYDGPDFLGALVEVEGKPFAGAIEIHRRVEDWFLHKHQENPRYKDVVLHVVLYPPDGPVPSGLPPTVVITGGLTPSQRRQTTLQPLRKSVFHACASGTLPTRELQSAALILAAESRFRRKCSRILECYCAQKGPVGEDTAWKQCLYELLARSLGYGGNADALQLFAHDVPLVLLRGVAASSDISINDAFESMAASRIWRSKGVRPGNRIQSRLPQLSFIANALLRSDALNSMLTAVAGAHPLAASSIMEDWIPGSTKIIGAERVYEMAINVFAPLAAVYAEQHDRPSLKQAALRLYFESRNAPGNKHTRTWQAHFGTLPAMTSGQQQGIIELRSMKCAQELCKNCLLASARNNLF